MTHTQLSPEALCQIEIPVENMERAKAFYQDVFEWEAIPAQIHGMTIMMVPEGCPYGISLVEAKRFKASKSITLYFAHTQPEILTERAVKSGGKVLFGPKKVQGYGEIFLIEDSEGNPLGLFRKAT